ncbi:MAG TPA: response regulator transcription factor [Ktedonobacterales bacterium]|nr:response regulator transcription factor [Ktedonobacterales bacterium]
MNQMMNQMNEQAQQSNAPRSIRVLVIDDEQEIGRTIRAGLASDEFQVEWTLTGKTGLEEVTRWQPDVIILDLFLPDQDGVMVCRAIRAHTQTPIIVLSVRESEQDKVLALNEGADDYLTKPFSMPELEARVRVALRHVAGLRDHALREARFQTGGLVIDFERRLVTVDGVEKHLTPTEYDTLVYLAQHAGMVVRHRELLRAVWGAEHEDEAHYLRVFVGQIRRKLEPEIGAPRYILTEPGIGYRLRAPETPGD